MDGISSLIQKWGPQGYKNVAQSREIFTRFFPWQDITKGTELQGWGFQLQTYIFFNYEKDWCSYHENDWCLRATTQQVIKDVDSHPRCEISISDTSWVQNDAHLQGGPQHTLHNRVREHYMNGSPRNHLKAPFFYYLIHWVSSCLNL